jgi:2-iminobutanoate/2-iminopropanoate deaminase
MPRRAKVALMRRLPYALLLLALPLLAEKKIVVPPEFAGGNANFSPAVMVDGTLYISGQLGQDLKTRQIPGDFEAEVKKALDNIGIVLKAAGMSYGDAVSVQVYLTDMDLFARMNAVYITVFKEPRPSRTTVGVAKLASPAAHIEITVTARK